MALLPNYFYDINATLPNGRVRWVDEFANESDVIFRPHEMNEGYLKRKRTRNEVYSRWMAAFFVTNPDGSYTPMLHPKMMTWQAIRVLSFKHSESSDRDWWEKYQDATFRVFVNPETVYDQYSKEHKQWYLLSPEDSYLVNEFELRQSGTQPEPRDYFGREQFLSADKRLRRARLIPVECCAHLRHEGHLGTDLKFVAPKGL